MATITVADSISVNQADRPLDARLRVASPEGIMSIESPYVGALVYCESDRRHYVITGLKQGPDGLAKSAVDTYVEFKGQTGEPGQNGTNGVSPTAKVTEGETGQFTMTVTDLTGSTEVSWRDGKDGKTPTITKKEGLPAGQYGLDIVNPDGQAFPVSWKDGVSPKVEVTEPAGGIYRMTVTDVSSSPQSVDWHDGEPGKTPFFTATAATAEGDQPKVVCVNGGDSENPTVSLSFSIPRGKPPENVVTAIAVDGGTQQTPVNGVVNLSSGLAISSEPVIKPFTATSLNISSPGYRLQLSDDWNAGGTQFFALVYIQLSGTGSLTDNAGLHLADIPTANSTNMCVISKGLSGPARLYVIDDNCTLL